MPPDMQRVGIAQADKQVVDVKDLPVIRQRVSPVDRAMTPEQARAYQQGTLDPDLPPASMPVGPAPLPPTPVRFGPPAGLPPASSAPGVIPAIPVPGQATLPADTDSVRKRIGRLVGTIHSWEERALAAEQRLQQTAQTGPPAPAAVPYTNQFSQFPRQQPSPPNPFGAPSEGPSPAGQPLSREEVLHYLNGQTQFILEQTRLRLEQERNQRAAESEFPDVFGDPDCRAAHADLMEADPYLRTDPRGPAKAAAMVRGMRTPPAGSFFAAGSPLPPADRKAALAGVGPSIATGSPAAGSAPSLEQEFADAMAKANRTGRMEDYADANLIRHRFIAQRGATPQT